MRTIILILLAAAIGLGIVARQQAATIKEQQQQIAAAEEHMKSASLALQGKCAEQASKMFNALGFRSNDMATYENHYNTRLNKCMVRVENLTVSGTAVFTYRYLVDAFENKQVGEFIWRTVGDKKYWQVPPIKCSVAGPSGEPQTCQSDGEFEKLAAAYMNG